MSKRGNDWKVGGVVTAAVIVLTWVMVELSQWPPPAPSTAAPVTDASSTSSEGADTSAPLDRLVVYGHSMPAGGGASSPDLGYAPLLAEKLGLPLVNTAEGGALASDVAETMASRRLPGAGDLALIHVGMNDILLNGERAVEIGKPYVDRLLEGVSDASRALLVLECQPRTWEHAPPFDQGSQEVYEEWNSMLRSLADNWLNVTAIDACAEWDADRYNDESGYHPSNEGHRLIARKIAKVVQSED